MISPYENLQLHHICKDCFSFAIYGDIHRLQGVRMWVSLGCCFSPYYRGPAVVRKNRVQTLNCILSEVETIWRDLSDLIYLAFLKRCSGCCRDLVEESGSAVFLKLHFYCNVNFCILQEAELTLPIGVTTLI